MLDPGNRRSKNVRDYRAEDHRLNLSKPVTLPVDFATISPREAEVARYRAEDAKTGRQTDEVPIQRRYKVRYPSARKPK